MPQSEDRDVKQESERPQNEKNGFRAGDIVITPLRIFKFLIFFVVCLGLVILLVRWMLK